MQARCQNCQASPPTGYLLVMYTAIRLGTRGTKRHSGTPAEGWRGCTVSSLRTQDHGPHARIATRPKASKQMSLGNMVPRRIVQSYSFQGVCGKLSFGPSMGNSHPQALDSGCRRHPKTSLVIIVSLLLLFFVFTLFRPGAEKRQRKLWMRVLDA